MAETHRDDVPRVYAERWGRAGYDVAGWCLPSEATGGDFFDFEEPRAGWLTVALGDVTGHGSAAARVAASCRALLRSRLAQTPEPARVLTEVNQLLCKEALEDRFVTAFFGILRSDTHQLEYMSAGQGPILFHAHDRGTIEELAIQGFPLGLAPGLVFEPTREVAFAPGDFLALVTDGFFEWVNHAGECYGIERTVAQLTHDRDRPAAEIIRRLHAGVVDFVAGAPQPDDLTAVVIKRVS